MAKMNKIYCAGNGPHKPKSGILGESDTVGEHGLLCENCGDTARAAVDPIYRLNLWNDDPRRAKQLGLDEIALDEAVETGG